MIVYRPGAITLEQIRAIAGPAELFTEQRGTRTVSSSQPRERLGLPSPGVGLRHYAPNARLILVEGEDSLMLRLREQATKHSGERVGMMLPAELPGGSGVVWGEAVTIFPWGSWSNLAELAQRLFAGLRFLDAQGCTVIVCPVPQGSGMGEAIRDRLRKAARTGADR
jgi:L-threonylcarbamoyladenylate synthase